MPDGLRLRGPRVFGRALGVGAVGRDRGRRGDGDEDGSWYFTAESIRSVCAVLSPHLLSTGKPRNPQ